MRVFALAAALVLSAVPAAAHARTIQLGDLRRIVGISDPQLSPDGSRAVALVSRANFDKDRYESDLVLVDVATGAQRVLTYQRMGLASPRWSPAGDRLAFLAYGGDADAKRLQIFVMPMEGGDATPITSARNGVEQFAWRPDGGAIAYVTPDDPANKSAIAGHHDEFVVGDNDYLQTAAPTASHVWIVDADGGPARRLTSGSWSVPTTHPPDPPSSPLSWSDDGKLLAITRLDSAESGDSDLSTVEVVDVATGALRKLTPDKAWEGAPVCSPAGNLVAYSYPDAGDDAHRNAIWITPWIGGAAGIEVTASLDRQILQALWMPDGRSLLVAGHDGTQAAMWVQPIAGPAVRIDTGDVNPTEDGRLDGTVGTDGSILFTGSEPGHPVELWYMASAQAKPRQLTDNNEAIASLALGEVRPIEWTGPDGFSEDGVLTLPPGFVATKKYPLVLLLHGGPSSASITSFGGFAQVLAAHGWIVFSPNYRGSDNLGDAFLRAIRGDRGDGPGRDVMAGIAAVEKMSVVDESRIAVSGWSFGGYLTSWLIGHSQTWKAAVAGAPMDNLVDQYDLSDENVRLRYGENALASPWRGNGMSAYLEQSPLTYARNVKTPTLILSDQDDARIPITESFEWYHALQDNGVTADFWEYPVSGDFPTDPVRSEDVRRRWSAWLAEYLK